MMRAVVQQVPTATCSVRYLTSLCSVSTTARSSSDSVKGTADNKCSINSMKWLSVYTRLYPCELPVDLPRVYMMRAVVPQVPTATCCTLHNLPRDWCIHQEFHDAGTRQPMCGKSIACMHLQQIPTNTPDSESTRLPYSAAFVHKQAFLVEYRRVFFRTAYCQST